MKIKYSDEQKKEAIHMLEELGPAKTKEILGIPSTTIYRWKSRMTPLVPDDNDEECLVSLEIPLSEETAEDATPTQNSSVDAEATVAAAESEDDDSVVYADRDSLVLGGLLMKLRYLNRENIALREENDNLRKAMVALLRGDIHA